ncbi:hypothetical protein NE865_13124 [Phthorimaea operculella]|nr:hypothetical protein NE865_13124 [Phthorimaea operculella]
MSQRKVNKCPSCRLIINELLAFLQSRMDVMSEKSLIDICANHNTVEEITTAKNLLFENVTTNLRQINRKSDKKRKDIQDIVTVLKEVNPKTAPIFVARDLHRLPPVNFDHVDASSLLKNINDLRNEIDIIKKSYTTKHDIGDIKNEIINMITRENPTSIQLTRELDPQTPVQKTTFQHAVGDLSPGTNMSGPAGFIHTPIQETDNLRHQNNNKIVSSSAHKQIGAKSTTVPLPKLETPNSKETPQRIVEEGFHLVENKKKRKITNIRGAGINTNATLKVSASTAAIDIYVSGFDKSVPVSDLKEYLNEIENSVISVELLPERDGIDFSAFKIKVPREKAKVILNPNIWPVGITVGKYRPRAYNAYRKREGVWKKPL